MATVELPQYELYVAGGSFPPASGRFYDTVDPYTGQPWARVPDAGDEDVDRAVGAARTAFEGEWGALTGFERSRLMHKLADLIERDADRLAELESRDSGKLLREFSGQMRLLPGWYRYFAGWADKLAGESIPSDKPNFVAFTQRVPVGVVAAVVPWNFPLTIGAWKFAPALAAGCTVVLKTAEQSPLSMPRVAELALAAGLPPGVLTVLSGDGATVGRRLGEHPDIDVLTFTGSTAVGRHFLRYAAGSNVKRVHLELGGKSPNIIFPDAPDLAAAADTAAWAVFFNSGQMCTAGSRLLVHRDVADEVVDRIVATAASWQPDDPLLPATRMGPLASAAGLDRVRLHLARGLEEGASLRHGGSRVHENGFYLEPTVVTGADRDNVLVREELFAPVLTVQTFADEDGALRIAHDTEYGLAAAVWTADLARAHRMSRRLRAGTVWVNCYEEGDMTVPFGGVKLSGAARDKSRHALDQYTDLKTTWINLG